MNTYELRPHQVKFISDIRESLRTHQSVLGRAPTGMGKTVCAAAMTKTAESKGARVMFMVHRRELVEQTSKTFHSFGIHHGVIQAGHHHNDKLLVSIASVGTLVNRLKTIRPPKLLIVDEAHHSAALGWAKCVGWAKDYGAKIVGLTATPWRLSGEGLREHFSHMIHGPETGWLIEHGYLSQYRAFAPTAVDLSDVHTTAGDYARGELDALMRGKAIVGDIVRTYREKARGRKTVLFAVSIAHSEEMAAQFCAAGISAVHIDANTPKEERRARILDFANGGVEVICNVDLFGEGFDLGSIVGRDVPIECVIQARPTQSLSLHLQQLGRALRPKPEPAILLDHAGNIARHGLPDSDFTWSLDAREKKRGNKDEALERARTCPKCFYTHAVHINVCPGCGYKYPPSGRQLEEVKMEMREVSKEELVLAKRREQAGAKTLDDLIRLAYSRGYAPGKAEKWASYVYTARQQKQRQQQYQRYGY